MGMYGYNILLWSFGPVYTLRCAGPHIVRITAIILCTRCWRATAIGTVSAARPKPLETLPYNILL